jgi:prepilin-type processing-associated H-X9-DG protein
LGGDRNGDRTGDRNRNGLWDPGDELAVTDYGGMAGSAISGAAELMNGVLIYDRPIAARDIRDGLSQTILVAEDTGRGASMDGEWSNGENIFDQSGPINSLQNNEMWSDHPGGANALFCDGSAHFLSASITADAIGALCSRAQGEPLTDNSTR